MQNVKSCFTIRAFALALLLAALLAASTGARAYADSSDKPPVPQSGTPALQAGASPDGAVGAPSSYSVNVSNGQADVHQASPGDTVSLKADENAGGRFVKWQSDDGDVEFLDYADPATSFVMPAHAVNITAVFEGPAATAHDFTRLAGPNAFDTMTAIVDYQWLARDPQSKTVVVATRASFKDALAACPLAGLGRSPVLLTNGTRLADQTRAELVRLKPQKVYLVGGEKAIGNEVETQIDALTGAEIVRVAGETAIGTSLQIAREGDGRWGKTAIIASTASFQDALSAAPIAYAKAMPLILTDPKAISDEAVQVVKDLGITRAVIVGGPAAVSVNVKSALDKAGVAAERIFGNDSIETSAAVAKWAVDDAELGMSSRVIGVATSRDFADALCGAALAGSMQAPIVLVKDASSKTIGELVSSEINHLFVFGGRFAVSEAVEARLVERLWSDKSTVEPPEDGGRVPGVTKVVLGNRWKAGDSVDAESFSLEWNDFSPRLFTNRAGIDAFLERQNALHIFGDTLDKTGTAKSESEALRAYDDAFFAKNDLVCVKTQMTSGSFTFDIVNVACGQGGCVVNVKVSGPGGGDGVTDDMAYGRAYIPIRKGAIADPSCIELNYVR